MYTYINTNTKHAHEVIRLFLGGLEREQKLPPDDVIELIMQAIMRMMK